MKLIPVISFCLAHAMQEQQDKALEAVVMIMILNQLILQELPSKN